MLHGVQAIRAHIDEMQMTEFFVDLCKSFMAGSVFPMITFIIVGLLAFIIVTIARQFGSLGRPIAMRMSEMIRAVDEARDHYHMHYAGFLPNDQKFKEIMIDSSMLGTEGTADYLVDAVKMKFITLIS